MAGMAPALVASVVRMAAPVGVTSSRRTPVSTTGKPFSNSAVPGPGTGMGPWGPRIIPPPIGRAEQWTASTPRRWRPMHAPVMSTIASTAPTSWNWTRSGGIAVHPPLGLGETREDARRLFLDRRGKIAVANDVEDAGQGAVRMRLELARMRAIVTRRRLRAIVRVVVHVDVDLGRPKVSLHHLPALERVAGQPEPTELITKRLERKPRIDERAHDHVPGHPTGTIEISNLQVVSRLRGPPTHGAERGRGGPSPGDRCFCGLPKAHAKISWPHTSAETDCDSACPPGRARPAPAPRSAGTPRRPDTTDPCTRAC